MYNVSAGFLTAIKQNAREVNAKIVIGVTEIPSDGIIEFSLEESFGSNKMPTIGGATSTSILLKLDNAYISLLQLINVPIKPYVAVKVNGVDEWIPMGVFYAENVDVTIDKVVTTIEAFDKMDMLDRQEYTSALTFPSTTTAMVQEIATNYGITYNTPVSKAFNVKPTGTVRQVIGLIAMVLSANAMFDKTGKLTFKFKNTTTFTIDGNSYIDYTMLTKSQSKITQLRMKGAEESEDMIVGDSTGVAIEISNVGVTTLEQLQSIHSAVYPFYFQPYTMELQGMPHLEVGDTFTFVDVNNNTSTLMICHHSFQYNGGFKSKYEVEAPKTETDTVVVTQTGGISISGGILDVSRNMLEVIKTSTALITGNEGGHIVIKPNENGEPEEILIMDTTDINTAMKVWRWNSSGLGYSSTGYNGTYALAITADGSIVADFITTGILNANRIRAGVITSTDGLSYWNLDTGEIVLNVSSMTINAKQPALKEDLDTLITSTVVEYYLSSSSTALVGGSWSTTAPAWTNGMFMWARTKVTYKNASVVYTPSVTGTNITGATGSTGGTGDAGRSISNVSEEYYHSTSLTTLTGGSWSTTVPTWVANKYVWTRTVITFINPSGTTTTTPVSISGQSGANGISITGVTEYYLATSASTGVTTATAGWTTAIQTMTVTNKYLWNYEVITYSSGSPTTTAPVIIGAFGNTGNTGSTGATGRALNSVTEHYLASSSASGVTRATAGWTTTVQTTTPTNKYLWNYETLNWSVDPLVTYVEPVIIGVHGEKGLDGKAITSVDVWYYLSTSSTALAGGTWSTTAPTWVNGSFMWSKTVTTYSTGSPTESTPVCITGAQGSTGSTGATGKGVSATAVTYQSGSTGTTAPTGTWLASVPAVSAGNYLWTRTVITYTDASTSTSYSVGGMGVNGATGSAGKGISAVAVTYQSGTSGTVTPTGTWLGSVPAVSATHFLWTRTITTYTDATSTTAYSVGMMGATGQTGATGGTGATGKGVTSISEEYAISTSKTVAPTVFSPTMPVWTAGNYIWTRSKIIYNNPTSTEYTTPIVSSEWEAVNEIKIGARNLVIRFDEISESLIDTNGAISSSVENSVMSRVIPVTAGEVLTFTKETTTGTDQYWRWKYLNSTQVYMSRVANLSNEFQLTIPADVSFIQVSYPSESNPKVERGNKATGWTLSPEDIEYQIGNKADSEFVNDIAGELDALEGVVSGKADAGSLSDLQQEYYARLASQVVAEGLVTDALESLDSRVALVTTEFGAKKITWNFIENKIEASEEGIFIGDKETEMGIFISVLPDPNDATKKIGRISFIDSGTEVAYITNNIMQINHGIFVESAIIGKHKIETIKDTDISVFTFIG